MCRKTDGCAHRERTLHGRNLLDLHGGNLLEIYQRRYSAKETYNLIEKRRYSAEETHNLIEKWMCVKTDRCAHRERTLHGRYLLDLCHDSVIWVL